MDIIERMEAMYTLSSDRIASNDANRKQREILEDRTKSIREEQKKTTIQIENISKAIELLHGISDESVSDAEQYIMENINAALERIFTGARRRIRITEYTKGQHPQLELELEVEDGVKRSLRYDSGHGIAQLISLLVIVCVIAITDARRLVVLDEVLSGLSVENRMMLMDILEAFGTIGYQFIINEHGFVPKNSSVYVLTLNDGKSTLSAKFKTDRGMFGLSVEELIAYDGMGDTDIVSV